MSLGTVCYYRNVALQTQTIMDTLMFQTTALVHMDYEMFLQSPKLWRQDKDKQILDLDEIQSVESIYQEWVHFMYIAIPKDNVLKRLLHSNNFFIKIRKEP